MSATIIPFPTKVRNADPLQNFVERMDAWRQRPASATDYAPNRLPASWSSEERSTYALLTSGGYQTHERAFNHVAALHAVGPQLPGEDYVDWLGRRARATIEEMVRDQHNADGR